MTRRIFVVVITVVLLAGMAEALTVYKWDAQSKTWKVDRRASVTASNTFTTSVKQEVIPIEFLSGSEKVKFHLKVDISSVKVRFITTPVTSRVFGKWTVDNMYTLLNSTNDLRVSYSIEGNSNGYYLSKVDENIEPPENFERWKKMDKMIKTVRLNVSSGTHEFYLWLGFDKIEETIFVGPIVFDTYVVPNI